VALVAALEDAPDVPTALRQYEAARLPEGRRIIQRARHLGAYMQAQLSTEDERAAAARHRSPEAVMAETALLDF
jgi:2-polyprenyl-6-methoxyphenol hydroxylase-like FAD-dependent oxidoreductase